METKAGNTAFGLAFSVCAAIIVIQLIAIGELAVVAGETVVLLVGGAAYIGIMGFGIRVRDLRALPLPMLL